MAIRAVVPLVFVFTSIYREVLGVVVPIRRTPGARAVTSLTIGREIGGLMIWIGRANVCRLMA